MSNDTLRFGTAGIPRSSPGKTTEDGVRHVKTLGLEAMELEFVYGVRLGEERARGVGELAREQDVSLSVHAPYYINLNAQEPEKLVASRKRIIDSAVVGAAAGANSIVFHPGFYLKMEKEKVYRQVRKALMEIHQTLDGMGVQVSLRPETTGKKSQFGSYTELLKLSAELDGVMPCVDIAHLHARAAGAVNSFDEFHQLLGSYEEMLGAEALRKLHLHVAGIAYTDKGERNHLNLLDSDLDFSALLQALREFNCAGTLICESPNLEEDALLLRKTYLEC